MKRAVLTYRDEKKAGPYHDALRAAGIDPVGVTPEKGIESLQSLGLVLSGGADVEPALYGQEPDPRTQAPDHERDWLEQRLLREALAMDLPVLAICRGIQLFNVIHKGGTLVQHLEGHQLARHETHDVEIGERTQLAKILGAGVHAVNSRHHQAVAEVGEGLVVSARTPTRLVEGLERPDRRFAIAVQWHPEDMLAKYPVQRRLFEALREAL